MEKHENEAFEGLKKYSGDGTPADIVERYASLPELVDQIDLAGLDDNVVVVDTETTGFSFAHDELIQIAAARMTKGQVTGWYVTFVNPGKPIPDEIVHLTGIGEEEVADAPTPEEALAREIREELHAEIEIVRLVDTVQYDYPKFHMDMSCYLCRLISDEVELVEHEAARWLGLDDVWSVRWLPSDIEVIEDLFGGMVCAE